MPEAGFQVSLLSLCLRPRPFRFAHQLLYGSQVRNACHHHNGDSLFSSKTGANIVFSSTTARTAPIISDTHQTQWWAHSLLVTAGPNTRAGFIQPAPTCHPAKTPWIKNLIILLIRTVSEFYPRPCPRFLENLRSVLISYLTNSHANNKRRQGMIILLINKRCDCSEVHYKRENHF